MNCAAIAGGAPESGGNRGLGRRERRPVGERRLIYGKRRLREIDRRIRFLSKRLESAEVVDANQQRNRDQVFFGATLTYANGRGTEMTITIVGIDEADLGRGQVSWLSPIARALMKAYQGDIVDLRAPAGVDQIEVLAIRYGVAADSRPMVGLAFSASGLPAVCLARLR